MQKSSIPFFDRWVVRKYDNKLDNLSDYIVFGHLAASLFYSYDEPYTWDNLIVLSEIILTQSAIASWSKTLSQRWRPYVYDDDTTLKMKQTEDASQSFFSHHTSTVFALATYSYFYSYQFNGAQPLLAAGLFGTASICAGLRVASANHFLSDVVTGAVVGSGVSYLICRQHSKEQKIKFSLGWKRIGFAYNF
jgi:undecaprenyl-diphosphatase